jgi:hypothetical protein
MVGDISKPRVAVQACTDPPGLYSPSDVFILNRPVQFVSGLLQSYTGFSKYLVYLKINSTHYTFFCTLPNYTLNYCTLIEFN